MVAEVIKEMVMQTAEMDDMEAEDVREDLFLVDELGLDSIDMLHITNEIEKRFALKFDFQEEFRRGAFRSISSLTQRLRELTNEE